MQSDPNSRARDRKLQALIRKDNEIITNVYRNLLSSAEGRLFLWHLLDLGKWNNQPFQAKSELTAFACGEMNVGLQIHTRIVETDADGFLQMMKDRINVGREYSAARDADAAFDQLGDGPAGAYDGE